MLDLSEIAPARPRLISRAEYNRMVSLGFFEEDEKIELLRGVIVEMSPEGTPHAGVLERLLMLLAPQVVGWASVRVQSPFAASADSQPEPDLAVVLPGSRRLDHPGTALLLVEVAWSSLRKDRQVKTGIYAEAGVPEYWVVNLREGVVEVFRDPSSEGYRERTSWGPGSVLEPVALRGLRLAFDEFMQDAL
jgi:Uma2 family endonuclease